MTKFILLNHRKAYTTEDNVYEKSAFYVREKFNEFVWLYTYHETVRPALEGFMRLSLK